MGNCALPQQKIVDGSDLQTGGGAEQPPEILKPNRLATRFFGSVDIDMVRPVRAFGAIVKAVVAELQRTNGATVKLTLEIEASAEEGFAEDDTGIIRDNADGLKFKRESTGFE